MTYKRKSAFKNILNFLGIGLMLSFLFLYIFQLNDVIEKSYLIGKYKKNLAQISEENKVLKLDIAQNGFLKDLEAIALRLNFEKVEKVKYIQISKDSLAVSE